MTDPVELSFEGPATPIPSDVVPLTVRFVRGDRTVEVPGFWDGGSTYRVRFAPDEAGTWTWTSASITPELDGRSGEIDAPDPGRGGVRVSATYHFAHADGTPFRPVGATVYNWLHQSDELVAQTIDAVSGAGLNKLRFLVFPQAGNHTGGEPALMPFERDADGRWDVARVVPAFFQRLDDAVRRLGAAGIQADVLIFNAYDGGHYGLDGLTEEEDAAYLRYLVARLSAFENVWWSLCNEFDILVDRPTERWTRAGELLAAVDPHDRLRSIHQWGRLYDHNHAWVTHASIQNGAATTAPGRASMYREVYPKPIVLDEILYEGDEPERWGHLTAEELVHRFWIATVEGCYASHGESYVKPNGSLHIVEGGPFQGASPARLGFLRGILDELTVAGLDPIDHWWDEAYVSGVPRRVYFQYFGRSAPASWTFRLPQGNRGERVEVGDRFEVDVIDAWDMTVTPVGRVFTLTDVQRNDVYADGDPVALPEGRMVAVRVTRVS